MPEQIKYLLDEEQIPKSWYNLSADLPEPVPPVLHPGTPPPIGPADLEPLFPPELIEQEVSTERYIDIPASIRDIYRRWPACRWSHNRHEHLFIPFCTDRSIRIRQRVGR